MTAAADVFQPALELAELGVDDRLERRLAPRRLHPSRVYGRTRGVKREGALLRLLRRRGLRRRGCRGPGRCGRCALAGRRRLTGTARARRGRGRSRGRRWSGAADTGDAPVEAPVTELATVRAGTPRVRVLLPVSEVRDEADAAGRGPERVIV